MSTDKHQVPLCQNHLGLLFEALKTNKVKDVERLEHKLTKIEECVACTYVLKEKGSAAEALFK